MIEKSIFKDGANKNLTHPKQEKGITLVALIITIIVMMILVAVSVAVVINSDLLRTAQSAGTAYRTNMDKEQNIGTDTGDIKIGDKTMSGYMETIKPSKKKIVFFIKGAYRIEDQEYEVEEGITFRKWLNEYFEEGQAPGIIHEEWNCISHVTSPACVWLKEGTPGLGTPVKLDDIIQPDLNYHWLDDV